MSSLMSAQGKEDQSSPLPIAWGDLTDKSVNQLRRLNATIFPVKYNEVFYSEAIKAPKGFVKLAYYNELLVGAVCCRKERGMKSRDRKNEKSAVNEQVDTTSLYILTLGVLAPYRERGIGNQLINHVLHLVGTSPECQDIDDIYLHVQEGNEAALRFYKRYGFEVTEKLVGYYKRIEPANCFIVRKTLCNEKSPPVRTHR